MTSRCCLVTIADEGAGLLRNDSRCAARKRFLYQVQDLVAPAAQDRSSAMRLKPFASAAVILGGINSSWRPTTASTSVRIPTM